MKRVKKSDRRMCFVLILAALCIVAPNTAHVAQAYCVYNRYSLQGTCWTNMYNFCDRVKVNCLLDCSAYNGAGADCSYCNDDFCNCLASDYDACMTMFPPASKSRPKKGDKIPPIHLRDGSTL